MPDYSTFSESVLPHSPYPADALTLTYTKPSSALDMPSFCPATTIYPCPTPARPTLPIPGPFSIPALPLSLPRSRPNSMLRMESPTEGLGQFRQGRSSSLVGAPLLYRAPPLLTLNYDRAKRSVGREAYGVGKDFFV